MTLRAWVLRLALASTLVAFQGACHTNNDPFPTQDGDADLDADADTDADLDTESDADGPDEDADLPAVDGDFPTGPGPVTNVVQTAGMTLERLCDLDGDGDLDNAIGDLGSPAGDMLAMAMNSIISNYFEMGGRIVLHIPLVDELAGPTDPELVAIVFQALDTDDPADQTDDFTGAEPFYVHPASLDACGEPRFAFPGGRVEDGDLLAGGGEIPVPLAYDLDIVGRLATLVGTVGPGGLSTQVTSCAALLIREIGGMMPPTVAGDLTMLEVLLVGGGAWGIPLVPGLTPDLDLDDDGLEQFVLDEAGHIVECIDGDLTSIPGRDCWQDARMADGVSMILGLQGVGAQFAGRFPSWEDWFAEPCEGGPPDPSLFDPI